MNEFKKDNMKVKIYISIAFAISFITWLYFTPHITAYNIEKAAKAGDSATLSTYIDFPALKENLKGSLNAQMVKKMAKESKGDGFEALGVAMASALIGPIVDALVTPESLAMMINGEKPLANKSLEKPPKKNDSDLKITKAYESYNSFLINIKKNDSQDGPIGFVFTRNGAFSWKLTSIRLPNFDNTTSSASPAADNSQIEPKAAPTELWSYSDHNDKFDGRKQHVIGDIKSNQPNKASLVFRISKDGFEAFVNTGDSYICATEDALNVAIIFDDERPSFWALSTAKSDDALFFKNPKKFAEKLNNSKKAYLRIEDTCGKNTDIEIDTIGFSKEYSRFN